PLLRGTVMRSMVLGMPSSGRRVMPPGQAARRMALSAMRETSAGVGVAGWGVGAEGVPPPSRWVNRPHLSRGWSSSRQMRLMAATGHLPRVGGPGGPGYSVVAWLGGFACRGGYDELRSEERRVGKECGVRRV